ncbi:hypothetical protein GGF46_005530 [Coemansia sp. RSA 552]|nr:hypothetical protein GGF46_005530 [Coemansia sp. RSA 552]
MSSGVDSRARAVPDFCTADYLDAFSSVDRNIRRLISGKELSTAGALAASANVAPQSAPPAEIRFPRGFDELPPSLDVGGGDDEEATVAFLCSGLPHYEGAAPIHYDNLDRALDAYLDQQTGDIDEGLDDEEVVPDDSWYPHKHLAADASIQQLPSPQTLRGSGDGGHTSLSTFEGWIDFEALLFVAQRTIEPEGGARCCLGRRSETDFMLLYEIEMDPPCGQSWVVQIPKPAVPQSVFESEILSVAYVNENTQVPVPSVREYEFLPTNPVGVPYAILDQMPGEPLAEHWPSLGARQKRKVLDQIAEAVVQLTGVRFPLIGSLAVGDGQLVVGPLLDARQLEPGYDEGCQAGHPYGPFKSTREYYQAMILASHGALQCIEGDHAEPSPDTIELDTYLGLIDHFVADRAASGGSFVLMPESLDIHHFLIEPQTCRLTGVVDWTFCGTRPMGTLVQPPPFTFDDTPRWEPVRLEARMAYRRNLVRYRQWFKAGLQKKAWAVLGKEKSEEMAQLVCHGYWRYKFESEICENIQYTNPWTFRAVWQHTHPQEEFAVWFATAQAKGLAQ